MRTASYCACKLPGDSFHSSPARRCPIISYKLQASSVMLHDVLWCHFPFNQPNGQWLMSIHVAANEMEEIWLLLTERDVEHTNITPLTPQASSERHSGLPLSIYIFFAAHLHSITQCTPSINCTVFSLAEPLHQFTGKSWTKSTLLLLKD